jgi:hypothetical protein
VVGILKAEVDGNHNTEARGIKESGIGSTSFKDKVQREILLCPPYPLVQMFHLINLKAVSYKSQIYSKAYPVHIKDGNYIFHRKYTKKVP